MNDIDMFNAQALPGRCCLTTIPQAGVCGLNGLCFFCKWLIPWFELFN